MKKKLLFVCTLLITSIFIIGCAQTKHYVPRQSGTRYQLKNLTTDVVDVKINDLRSNKEKSKQLIQTIKGEILGALSQRKSSSKKDKNSINVNIIEHRSYFTLGNWHASTKLHVKFINHSGEMLKAFYAKGKAHRSNMWGYETAKAVSQDAYNTSMSDLISKLSTITLKEK